MSVPSAGTGAGRPLLPPVLRDADYRRLWLSGLFVNTARWIDLVTLGWLALQLTGSASLVGAAAFARSAPLMVVGPLGGIVADRMPRGRLLNLAQGGGVVTALTLAGLFGAGLGGYGPLVALEVVFGLVWALDFPARRTSLHALLGADQVARAVSLETVSMQIAKILGPLAAGLCLAWIGPAASFGLIAAAYAAGLLASRPLAGRLGQPGDPAPMSVAASLRAGLQAAWASRTVRRVLLVTVAMNTLFFPYQPMLPVFARDVLDLGPVALGALVAADGVGALIGALLIAGRRGTLAHRPLFGSAVVVAPILLVGLASSRWLPMCLLLLVVIGAAESAFAAMQSTLVLLGAPERVRGGAMGILSACIGTQPFGTLAIGALAASLGAPAAFTVNALAALLVIAPLTWPLVRGRPD